MARAGRNESVEGRPGARLGAAFFASLVLAILFGASYGATLIASDPCFGGSDQTHLLNPVLSHASRSFALGEFPYRLAANEGGLPIYAYAQLTPSYPFYALRWSETADFRSTHRHAHSIALAHLYLWLLAVYAMLRCFDCSPLASLLGAAVVGLSPDTHSYARWVNIVASYAWMPLGVGAVMLCLKGRRPWLGFFLGAFSIPMMTLASPSQSVIQFGFVTAVLCFGFACAGTKRVVGLARVGALAIVTIALTCPVLVPLVLSSDDSTRWIGEFGATYDLLDALPVDAMHHRQLRITDLAATIYPTDFGTLTGNPYVGAVPALLACVALFRARPRWKVFALLALVLHGLLSACGETFGAARINAAIPLLNLLREPTRHLLPFVLSVGALAALGFDALLTGRAGVRSSTSTESREPSGALRQVVIAVALAATLLPLLATPWLRERPSTGIACSKSNLRSHEILAAVASYDNVRGYRVGFYGGGLSTAAWGMNASYHDVRTFQAMVNPHPTTQRDQMFYVPRAWNPTRSHYLRLLGLKYYLSDDPSLAPPEGFRPTGSVGGMTLYEAHHVAPRFFLVSRSAGTYANPQEFWRRLRSDAPDFDMALFPESAAAWLRDGSALDGAPATGRIRIREDPQNSVELEVETEGRSLVVMNEYFTPDWRATLDGRPAVTHRVNLNQVGVVVPVGRSIVRFEFWPPVFERLRWIQRFAIALLLAAGLFASVRSRWSDAAGCGWKWG